MSPTCTRAPDRVAGELNRSAIKARMSRLVLNVILRLGRYAVLPVAALVCVIPAVWLMALDRYTITAPVVFCTFTAANAAKDIPARFDAEWRRKAQAWVTVGR